jgi:hypothetical protein
VAPGPYVVRGRFPGRAPVEVTGTVTAGKTVEVRLDMTPPPPVPPPVIPPPLPPRPSPTPLPTTSPPTTTAPPPTTPPPPTSPPTTSPPPPTISPPPATVRPTPPAAERVASADPPPSTGTTVDVTGPGATLPRRRSLSVFAGAIGAVVDPGVRGLIGVGYEPHRRFRLGLDVIIGAGPGIAPRGTVYLTTGRLRPVLHLSVPVRRLERLDNPMDLPCNRAVVAPDASRSASIELGVHGGLGLEWALSPRVALTAEVGYERYPSIDTCINEPGVITPVLGVVGRL